jgi:hypothetical protein
MRGRDAMMRHRRWCALKAIHVADIKAVRLFRSILTLRHLTVATGYSLTALVGISVISSVIRNVVLIEIVATSSSPSLTSSISFLEENIFSDDLEGLASSTRVVEEIFCSVNFGLDIYIAVNINTILQDTLDICVAIE